MYTCEWSSAFDDFKDRKHEMSVCNRLISVVLPMPKRYVQKLTRRYIVCLFAIAFVLLVTNTNIKKPIDEPYINGLYLYASQTYKNGPLRFPTAQGPRKDWHDHAAIDTEKARRGLGEQGLPAYNEPHEKELENEIFGEFGINILLSDKISVNRSVKDLRHEKCKSLQYLSKLPSVSVVFVFFNEHFSVLLRSIHSVVNRSPAELLKQIVLVDDGSDREYLKAQLDDYVAANWPRLVQLVRIPQRRGLIYARLTGIKVATNDIVVIFDSHIEVNYNWLPPLIEPIAIDRRIATEPIIDEVNFIDFSFKSEPLDGSRGGFDFNFYYKRIKVLPEDSMDKTQPFRNPVMMGGLFAINREFFWELGGFDDQLDIWGGEQYELSFKIWMCGGMLLGVPCSRVAHLHHGVRKPTPRPRNYEYSDRNHKRIIEVWMDEYKEHVYRHQPLIYNNVDPGDLSKQYAIRKRLQCKSFHWFMTVVAPDFLERFPPVQPVPYASGTIQNVEFSFLCLDSYNQGGNYPVGLFDCHGNLTHPSKNQFWVLTQKRDIRRIDDGPCLDVYDSKPNATVWMLDCHGAGGNQFWWYDRRHQWIVHGEHGTRCMEAVVEGDQTKVYVNICDSRNQRMRWTFGTINHKFLDNFFKYL